MSAPQRRHTATPVDLGSTTPDPPRDVGRPGWWVSEDAVRRQLGAWAATARTGRARPTTELVRTAVGVTCAVAELATASPALDGAIPLRPRGASAAGGDAAAALLTRPVAATQQRLSEMCGVSVREVERALEVLRDARVVLQPHGDRGAVSLSPDCLAPAPAVAAIAWPVVRERLATAEAPFAAPCATLRALADRIEAFDLGRGAAGLPPVRMSVRDLELVTEFRRSTVSDAVAALVRARLIDADARAGHTGRFVIRPAAFGFPDEEPTSPQQVPGRSDRALRPSPAAELAQHRGARDGSASPTATSAEAPALIGTFAGTPIYAPPGTPLTVECDVDGRWWCRVGPHLRLGPAAG